MSDIIISPSILSADFAQLGNEIKAIESGKSDAEDNLLKNAPHTDKVLITDDWNHSYGREQAAFPLPWIQENKFWIPVGRVDDAYGDRNLVCSCNVLLDID